MTVRPHRVAIVVDPEFGDRLDTLALRVHTWIADTATNRAAADRYWSAQKSANVAHSLEHGVTTFRVDLTTPPEDWCASIVDVVEEHHGPWSHEPPVTEVEVYGTPLSAALRTVFAAVGFDEARPTPYGFEARSRSADST
jgi:hypothetical protein